MIRQIIAVTIWLLFAILVAPRLEAHAPLDLLRDAHCQVETQGTPEHLKDTVVSKAGAVGRCQIMPGTARYLAWKFRWDSEIDLTLRDHSEALAHQRLIVCRQSLYRRYKRAPQRSMSWCYLSGQLSISTPHRGFYAYYLDQIEEKLGQYARNRTNWMAWKIIKEGDRG